MNGTVRIRNLTATEVSHLQYAYHGIGESRKVDPIEAHGEQTVLIELPDNIHDLAFCFHDEENRRFIFQNAFDQEEPLHLSITIRDSQMIIKKD